MFAKIRYVIAWIPQIISAVILVEDLLSDDLPGETKKERALQFLGKAGLAAEYVTVVAQVIDLVVAVLHVVNIFRHKKSEEESETVPVEELAPEVRTIVESGSLQTSSMTTTTDGDEARMRELVEEMQQ